MKTYRVQFDLPENKVRDLEQLMTESGTQTKKELFNNALTLLEWAIKARRQGRIIASIDEADNKYSELQMPILSAIATTHSKEEHNNLISAM